jgi:hypothetical protein
METSVCVFQCAHHGARIGDVSGNDLAPRIEIFHSPGRKIVQHANTVAKRKERVR